MSVSDPVVPAVVPPPPPRSAKTVVIAVIVLIVTFVAGMAAGVLLDHLRILRHPHRDGHLATAWIMRRLEHNLDLTPEQHKKVEEIVERHHRRIFEISENVRPQIHRELEAANTEIKAVLTPEQREKFEKMKMRLGHPRERRRRGPTG